MAAAESPSDALQQLISGASASGHPDLSFWEHQDGCYRALAEAITRADQCLIRPPAHVALQQQRPVTSPPSYSWLLVLNRFLIAELAGRPEESTVNEESSALEPEVDRTLERLCKSGADRELLEKLMAAHRPAPQATRREKVLGSHHGDTVICSNAHKPNPMRQQHVITQLQRRHRGLSQAIHNVIEY